MHDVCFTTVANPPLSRSQYVYILFQLLLLVVFLLYTNANVLIDLHCVCCHVNIWYCIMKCSLTMEAVVGLLINTIIFRWLLSII